MRAVSYREKPDTSEKREEHSPLFSRPPLLPSAARGVKKMLSSQQQKSSTPDPVYYCSCNRDTMDNARANGSSPTLSEGLSPSERSRFLSESSNRRNKIGMELGDIFASEGILLTRRHGAPTITDRFTTRQFAALTALADRPIRPSSDGLSPSQRCDSLNDRMNLYIDEDVVFLDVLRNGILLLQLNLAAWSRLVEFAQANGDLLPPMPEDTAESYRVLWEKLEECRELAVNVWEFAIAREDGFESFLMDHY